MATPGSGFASICCSIVLVSDLVGQLTSVAHGQNRGDARLGLVVHLLHGVEMFASGIRHLGPGRVTSLIVVFEMAMEVKKRDKRVSLETRCA